MKKSGWIIISFLILFTFTLEAQIDWGVRVGAARSSLTQKVDGMFRSKGRFGFSVAGIADISLKNRWTLRPEVAFVHEGGGYVSNWTLSGVNLLENKYKYYSLQVPINVAYNIPLSDVTLSYPSVFGRGAACPFLEDREEIFMVLETELPCYFLDGHRAVGKKFFCFGDFCRLDILDGS